MAEPTSAITEQERKTLDEHQLALPELRKIRPEVKVLISSGYSDRHSMTVFQGQQVSGFLQKPYTSAKLAETVKRTLS